MNIAYLDCASGISGDMTLGALVDAGAPLAEIQRGIDSLGLPSCRLVTAEVRKKGFRALQVTVEHEPEHAHRHLHQITEMIAGSSLTPRQQELAARIFTRLGEAEARVHGLPLEKVHFHEVGAADSIADIVGAAIGWDLLGIARIECSPIPTGRGFVQIAHGRCSIPAPATAELLRGVPLADSRVDCELTTPTGAAIVAAMVDQFGPLPAMNIKTIGYGAGQRDLKEQPNLLRLLIGQANAAEAPRHEQVWLLETNLDDVPGELVGYCQERLLESGALDVYTTAIGMKKNRPAVMLSVLCSAPDIERLEQFIFDETGTLGVRRAAYERTSLERQEATVETPWGPVAGKRITDPHGRRRFSPEYEECRRIAREQELPLREVYEAVRSREG